MVRRGACVIVSAVVLAVLLGVSARAADDVLKIIPSNALAWGAVHRLAETDAKGQKIAELVQGQQFSVLDLLKNQASVQKGLDDKGSAGLIVMPNTDKDENPTLVYFAPVTNYKQFLENFNPEKTKEKVSEVQILGESFVMANRGSFALIAKPSDRDALEAVLSAKTDVTGEVAGLESWLKENDGELVATSAGIKLFAAKVREALKKNEDMFADAGMQNPAMNIKAMLDLYGKVIDAAEKEVSLAALGVRADKESTLRLVSRVRFAKGGQVERALGDVKLADGDLMAGLPGGPFVFAGAGTAPGSLTEALMGFSMNLIKGNPEIYGLNAEQTAKLAKISSQTMHQIHSMGFVMKTGKRDEPMYSNMYGVFHVDNAQQFVADYAKQIAGMNEILKGAKEGLLKPTTVTKTEIGSHPALEMAMTMPMPKMPAPLNEQMTDKMFGPGGKTTMWIVAADERTALFGMGVSKEKMLDAVTALKDSKKGLSGGAEVAETATLLSPGAQGVGYVSVGGYVQFTQRMMTIMMAGLKNVPNFTPPTLPPFPKCPSVGMALKAAPGEVQGELVVPSAIFKASGEYTKAVQQSFMQQSQPGIP